MMMETVVYAREYLFIKELYDKGELGKLQFLQASHQQDMDGWPNYWPGLPPMYYATHCVGPCSALTDADGGVRLLLRLRHDPRGADRALRLAVRGRDRAHQVRRTRDLTARIYRSLFDIARQYRESIDVYGSKKSFEWPLIEDEHARPAHGQAARAGDPRAGQGARTSRTACRSRSSASRPRASTTGEKTHLSLHAGRRPRRLASAPRARVRHARSSRTATRSPTPCSRPTGPASACCAHESALKGGELVRLPEFTLRPEAVAG